MKLLTILLFWSTSTWAQSDLIKAAKACFEPSSPPTVASKSQWIAKGCHTGAVITRLDSNPQSLQIIFDNPKGMVRVYRFEVKASSTTNSPITYVAKSSEFVDSCGRPLKFSLPPGTNAIHSPVGAGELTSLPSDISKGAEVLAKDITQFLTSIVKIDPSPLDRLSTRACYSWLTAIVKNHHLESRMNNESIALIQATLVPGPETQPELHKKAQSAAAPGTEQ